MTLAEIVAHLEDAHAGSHHSRMQPASASARPSRRSAVRNRTIPPVEGIDPPLKPAVTLLRCAAG